MKVSERRIVWVKRGGAGGGSVGWSEAGALSQLGIRPAGSLSLSLSLSDAKFPFKLPRQVVPDR